MTEYKEIKYHYTPEQKKDYWEIGLGLQEVDNIKPSHYMYELVKQNIDGKLSIDEVKEALKEYYRIEPEDSPSKEADLVSTQIVQYLQESEFTLHPLTFKKIHRFLFKDVPDIKPGEYKVQNFSKAEAILNGFSVRYEDWQNVEDFLEYDINNERKKDYANLSDKEKIESISSFISGIWQIHPFNEGNTRTTAVFTIQYLNSLGFKINNEPFKNNAKYFRNSLVRANFSDVQHNVSRSTIYLNRFLENALYNTHHKLDSQDLIVPELFICEKEKILVTPSSDKNIDEDILDLLYEEPEL